MVVLSWCEALIAQHEESSLEVLILSIVNQGNFATSEVTVTPYNDIPKYMP